MGELNKPNLQVGGEAKDKGSMRNRRNIGQLKPSTKAFIDLLDGSKKHITQTDAYLATHKTTNRNAAAVEASRTLRNPNVIIYRKKHALMAVKNIVAMASDKRVHEATRLKANIDILDRFDGKAVQRVQSESTNLNINVEASEELNNQFTEFLKGKTQI